MQKKDDIGEKEHLRNGAESRLRGLPRDTEALSFLSPEDLKKLLHELRVHQIELEMQNDELRLAQVELEEARNKYSDLYDFAPIAYFTIDDKGLIKEVNLTGASLLGMNRTVLIGKPFTRFIFKDDQNIFYFHRQKLMETESTLSCELRLQKKDGHAFIAHLDSIITKDKDRNAALIRAAVTDITERKQAEEALRKASRFSEKTLSESPVGIIIYDAASGQCVAANNSLAKLIGATKEEVLAQNFHDIKSWKKSDLLETAKSALEENAKKHLVTELNTTFGKKLFLECYFAPFSVADQNYLLLTATDISKCVRAEEALRESEGRFRLLFDNSADAHVLYKGDQFIDCNQACLDMLGFTAKKQLLTLHPAHISPKYQPDAQVSREKAESMIALAFEKGSHRFDWLCQQSDGSDLSLDVLLNVIKTQGESLIHGVWRDITDLKRAEKEQEKLQAQLSNALEMAHLGHWEYDVANDLFTFNDQFYKMLRTTAERVGGYTMSSAQYTSRFVHPEDRSVVEEETCKAIEATDSNFSRELEHRILKDDGTIGHITVRFFIVKDSQGRTIRTHGVNQEITERKEMENALRDSNEKLNALIQSSPSAIIALDLDRNITLWNATAEKTFGWQEKEVMGRFPPLYLSIERVSFIP